MQNFKKPPLYGLFMGNKRHWSGGIVPEIHDHLLLNWAYSLTGVYKSWVNMNVDLLQWTFEPPESFHKHPVPMYCELNYLRKRLHVKYLR